MSASPAKGSVLVEQDFGQFCLERLGIPASLPAEE